MKRLVYICAILFLLSCNRDIFILENKTMIPGDYLSIQLKVNKKQLHKIRKKYKRNGYSLYYEKCKGKDCFMILFTKEEIEATIKNKGKRSILKDKYNKHLKIY